MKRLIHDGTKIIRILDLPDGSTARTVLPAGLQQFDAASLDPATWAESHQGLVFAITPAQKQLVVFQVFAVAHPAKAAPFIAAHTVEIITALNATNEVAAKAAINAIPDNGDADLIALRAELIACY